MIKADAFLKTLYEQGFEFISGVPCSYLTPIINAAISGSRPRFINATNEGDAIAIACGVQLGGKRGAVMFQNSGLGNAVNPITSLAKTFQLPVLILCTWRGRPGGPADEPQHRLMGRITCEMFKLMEVPVRLIPQTPLDVVWRDVAEHWTLNQGPFALVILENAFAPCSLEESDEQHPVRTAPYEGKCRIALDPDAILATIRRSASTRDALISTTGYTSRALYALADDPSHFYMIGSMGCASSLALGVSLAQPTRRVITIDGDGAALMRLGAMAALGHYRPANLVHILLDNGLHESTGGQSTVAKTVNFLEVAAAVNYARVVSIEELAHLEEVLAQQSEGLTFIYVRSARRHSRELPRPRHSPPFFAERFSQWLQTTS